MIRAIAIDDEPLPLEIITAYCNDVSFVVLEKIFSNPTDAKTYLKQNSIDLLLLDIQMPSISGLDFYKELVNPPMVIFTTAHSKYALEGFEVNAIDYLLKPYSFERFSAAVTKAKEYFEFSKHRDKQASEHIFIKADYSIHKVILQEILFIEGLADYLKIHLPGNKMLITRMTMKGMLEQLSATDFIRVHRSFIVPLKKIQSVRNKIIQLGNAKIPIGDSYANNFFAVFK